MGEEEEEEEEEEIKEKMPMLHYMLSACQRNQEQEKDGDRTTAPSSGREHNDKLRETKPMLQTQAGAKTLALPPVYSPIREEARVGNTADFSRSSHPSLLFHGFSG
ncbi:unnamed protein product [Pleuronectes platessa]|uniref:Uncharacterized protein n=1 Tax=Pleuronectes platessa TaxID=8262 RepID=A0A9N7TIP7_PLEPL|nr:unnamed protein product [Pleuronectes platessa]